MEIFKILSICLIVAVLCVLLKQYKSEYALLLSLSASVCLLIFLIGKIITPLKELISEIEALGVDTEYFKVAFKALVIGYITSFAADTCKESGQTALASKAIFAGKTAIFLLSLPLALSLLKTAIGFIK